MSPRRDLVGWTQQNESGWTERLELNVFRFPEVDTICITVGVAKDPYRMYACLGIDNLPGGWNKLLDFYAFQQERPGTEMISVGMARDRDPARSIFVRGEHADRLEGWEEQFVFWVPI